MTNPLFWQCTKPFIRSNDLGNPFPKNTVLFQEAFMSVVCLCQYFYTSVLARGLEQIFNDQ